MSAQRFEAFLAHLYTDADARRRFLADPRGAATRAGLDPAEVEALDAIDHPGLELTAQTSEKKRERRMPRRPAWRRWLGALSWRHPPAASGF